MQTQQEFGLGRLQGLVTTALIILFTFLLLSWSPLTAAFLVCMVAIVVGIALNEDFLDYEPNLGLLSFQ